MNESLKRLIIQYENTLSQVQELTKQLNKDRTNLELKQNRYTKVIAANALRKQIAKALAGTDYNYIRYNDVIYYHNGINDLERIHSNQIKEL